MTKRDKGYIDRDIGFSTIKYGIYKCKGCGKSCKMWIESLCYKKKLCAKCLDAKGLGVMTGREKR